MGCTRFGSRGITEPMLRTRSFSTTHWRPWVPGGMRAAILYPERRVLAVCGDGGFMMNSQEMETAVRLKLNLVVLILEDSAYGMIRWKQAVDHFPDFGLTFGNPDFVRYAESYGAKGTRIENTDAILP